MGEKEETVEDVRPGASERQQAEDVPPNGGYGWVCTACVSLINAHTWGINSSYGVFLAYYLDNNVYPGATHLQFAFIGGLSIGVAMLVSPISTTTTRLFGTQTTLLIGVFFETLSLIGASWAREIWQLFLSQGVCFGVGMGFLFVGSVGVIPQWFTTRRSIANGIGAAGSGFGGLIYSLATNSIIKTISLAWAFRILGIVSGAVNLTCALIIRDRSKAIGAKHAAFSIQLTRRPEVLLIFAWGFFSMLGYVTLLFSLPNYGTSIGLTAQQGSIVGAILNLGQGLGRPPVGYFSDTFGRINMAALATFLPGIFSLAIWIPSNGFGVLTFFALIVGFFAGSFWGTVAPVSAEIIGLQSLPTGLSMMWLVLVLPTLFSEPIALEIANNSSAKYLGTQLFAAFMYIAAGMCLMLVRSWKVNENRTQRLQREDSDRSESSPDKAKENSSTKQRGTFIKDVFAICRV